MPKAEAHPGVCLGFVFGEGAERFTRLAPFAYYHQASTRMSGETRREKTMQLERERHGEEAAGVSIKPFLFSVRIVPSRHRPPGLVALTNVVKR